MIPGDRFHNQRCYHHKDKDFHRSHHSHSNSASDGVSIQKSGTREIKVVRRVLDVNDKMAEQNRRLFAEKGIFVLNVMSSPGSGKTTTLEKTLALIMPEIKSAVIVGDICTTHDADRLAGTGVPVVQINTDEFGGDCHLVAHVIEKAASTLELDEIEFLVSGSRSLTYHEFIADETLIRAFSRSLEIIGEASKKIPASFKKNHPDIEWRAMAGMRDKLIHDYFGIDFELVWDVVKNKLPGLKKKIADITD